LNGVVESLNLACGYKRMCGKDQQEDKYETQSQSDIESTYKVNDVLWSRQMIIKKQ